MTTSSTTFRIPNFFPFPKISNHNNNLINPIIFCNHKYKYKYSSVSNLNPSIILKFNNSNNNNNNKKHSLSVSCFMAVGTTATTAKVAGDRLQRLVSEFESLTEPIDRVKRLLDYAARLPPFDESARVPGNRVVGCTTQVWLEARMDENGRMRFRADSDSEITKGFISCLIWLLDGADPDEVVAVKAEDLTAMNVGLYGKAQSRVNTWHNVLISMQNRTAALAAERKENLPITEPLSEASFVQAQFEQLLHGVMRHMKIMRYMLLVFAYLSKEITQNQAEWKKRIHIADPN